MVKTPYIILYFRPDLSVMKILIPDIPKEGIDLEVQETLTSDSVVFTVHGRLRVQKAASEVMIEGDLKAAAELQCSRCLKRFRSDMSIPVDVVYHPVDELKGDDHEIASEDLDLDFYTGDELDIDRLLKEQVALNIPMKPLCSEFCKGLCANCGADMNDGTCSCSVKITDSRFQELKKLLNERKE
jgi:uncharacterized protein